ncbi:MAG TPA: hypothetical protein PK585_02805 [Amphiplicatus sp.]|mgnify:CR=1 FL=1|nr:hypothetical protein [Amphiplicatus sp.]HRX39744.1 hypothetical protein [Parvularculaceae bacterium]
MSLKICIAAIAAAGAMMSAPADAQIGVNLGADLDVGVKVKVGEPYTYRGYHSDRWYPYEKPHRRHVYYRDYGGYDCYRAFRYTWDDGRRARYDSYWCYDDRGRDYEVRETRVVVRMH